MAEVSFPEILEGLQHSQMNYSTIVAAVLLMVYDYFLTLDREISSIWSSRWNVIKILFLLTRYMPILDSVGLLYYISLDGSSPETCSIVYKVSAWVLVIGIAEAEILLTIRTWGIWGKDRRLTIGLPIFYIVIWGGIFTFMGIYQSSLRFVVPPRGLESAGCFIASSGPIVFACWVGVLLYDLGILILMAIRAFPALRLSSSGGELRRKTLVKRVFQNGLIYYLHIFVFTLLNIVMIYPLGYYSLLSMFQRMLYSMLTCRVILDIRDELAFAPTHDIRLPMTT